MIAACEEDVDGLTLSTGAVARRLRVDRSTVRRWMDEGVWRGGGLVSVTSRDGAWVARTQEKAQPKPDPQYASEFEKRHQERFKGVQFDWKDFQRDGSPFPLPNAAAAPPLQILIEPAAGGSAKVILDKEY